MKIFEKIAINTIWQIVARLFSSGAGFISAVIIARLFGVSLYGEFAKVSSFVILFYLLVDFGLNPIFLQHKDNEKKFKDLLFYRLVLSFVAFALVNSVIFFAPYNQVLGTGFSPQAKLGVLVFSLTLFTEGIFYSASVIFQREFSYKLLLLSTSLGSLITVFFVATTAIFHLSIVFLFCSYLAGGIVESSSAIYLSRKNLLKEKVDKKFIKLLTIQAFPVALMLLLNLIYFRIDIIIISFFKQSKDVGIYDFAYRFFDFLIAVPLFISNTLYPIMLKKSESLSFKKTSYYIGIFFLISFIFVIPAWILSPVIAFVKKDFYSSIIVFRILLVSLPIFFITSIMQWVLMAKRQQKFLATTYFFLAVLNIGLNIVFVPQYSYIAASIITGVCELVVFVVFMCRIFLPECIWKRSKIG